MNFYDFFSYPLINTADDSLGSYLVPYIWFNIIEALCWLGCALRVGLRYARAKSNRHEITYCLAFLLFALSDVIETSGTTPLLLLFKLACILAIIACRRLILPHYHGHRF